MRFQSVFIRKIRRRIDEFFLGVKSFVLRDNSSELLRSQEYCVQPGLDFEEFAPGISDGKEVCAKVLAYYLPQYHEFPENNANWGLGFTEWTNIARSGPRYKGHLHPKIPRDLGFYDLTVGDIQRRQAEMAKKAGVHGFCYYYYFLDGKKLMHAPLERMLGDPSVDIPFCFMWANENWTRTWSGQDKAVLLEQKYDPRLEIGMVDDLARYFADPRYIRVQGKPLLVIYRVSEMPDPVENISRLRQAFRERHGMEIVILMAQTDARLSPEAFDVEGAAEFLPGKYKRTMQSLTDQLKVYDRDFRCRVLGYDELVEKSVAETEAPFPLARGLMPAWDNTPRRPGRGMIIHGSSPAKFEAWARHIVAYAQKNPILGEPLVFLNAWNEWAEGAVMEPDTHYGGAYLNALSRAVHGVESL